MTESGSAGIDLFREARSFWKEDSHRGLSELAIKNIEKVLKYSETPEGMAAISLRASQLDEAINRFNVIRKTELFKGEAQKESRKLAERLHLVESFPMLRETPLERGKVLPYLFGFRRLVGTYSESGVHYYTFLDKNEATTNEGLNVLITGLLVDGFAGFAFRARKVATKAADRHGRFDLNSVNTVCEMVTHCELQADMVKAGWYKPDYGLDPDFCKKTVDYYK